jgi:hypothetical protein
MELKKISITNLTHFHGNAWVAVMGLVEAVVARQQGNNMQQ